MSSAPLLVLFSRARTPSRKTRTWRFCGGAGDDLTLLRASAAVRGTDIEQLILQFVPWCATHDNGGWQGSSDGDTAFFAIGVAKLVVRPERSARTPDWLEQLGWWLLLRAEVEGSFGR